MDDLYFVSLECEVLSEMASGILTDISNFMDKKCIDDDDMHNPITLLYWKVNETREAILSSNTLEDTKLLEGELRFAKKYINSFKEFENKKEVIQKWN
jgi:hypothetical protein